MQLNDQDAVLLNFITSTFAPDLPKAVGVAVSGGGDSMALLHLMHRWAGDEGVGLQVATVDHGLREAAAQEAKAVAAFCAELGIEHSTLRWTDWDRKGNLQDQARRARYRLMTAWALGRGIKAIALGHTLDDQAETFLMRLARGSGVDGLSGMQPVRETDGIQWVRPVLAVSRQKLRDYLQRHKITWIDDPSNDDEQFDRVKARKILAALAPLGIDADRLVDTAQAMQSARSALERQTQEVARNMVEICNGDVVLDANGFKAQHPEIQSRLLSHALCWVSSAEYRPRRQALSDVLFDILDATPSVLHGCRILVNKSEIRITREHQAVKDEVCPTDAVWDRRWRFSGPHTKGLELRALGESGLAECPDWRAAGIPRASLLATPAVWQNDRLIAAPLAKKPNGWITTVLFGLDHFISSIKSH